MIIIFILLVTLYFSPQALLQRIAILAIVRIQTFKRNGRKALGEREGDHCVPQVWQSHSCRKIPHGGRWENGSEEGGMKELLASSPCCAPLPWKHICLIFSATHLFCTLCSPSISSNRDLSLLTATNISSYFGQPKSVFRHISCHLPFFCLTFWGLSSLAAGLFSANVLWPSDTLLLRLPQAVRLTCKYVSALQRSPF